MIETEQILRTTGLTMRQLNYWTTRGYLNPEGSGGSGNRYLWPPGEVRIAKTMKALVDADINPVGAARAARNNLILAPGIRIVLYDAAEDSP